MDEKRMQFMNFRIINAKNLKMEFKKTTIIIIDWHVFSCSPSRSFHPILHILVSSLTFLRVFLDSPYVFYFLFFLVAQSLSFILSSIKTRSPRGLIGYYYFI